MVSYVHNPVASLTRFARLPLAGSAVAAARFGVLGALALHQLRSGM